MAKKILIVSPRFVPVESPEQQRARTLLPHLRENGWEGAVLTVDDPSEQRGRDERLLATVPAGLEIVRVRCPRAWPGFGSLGLRSYRALKKAGQDWISRNKPDAVYLTTTEFDLFRLGPAWRKNLGVPYILDYQDPWVTDYYGRAGAPPPPGGKWKYAFSQWRARRAEPGCVKRAAGITSVSRGYVDDLKSRYPGCKGVPMETIPFGVSESDWELASRIGKVPWEKKFQDEEVWLNLGRLAPSMRKALEAFFYSLSRKPPPVGTVILFIGTSYQSGQVSELDPVALAARICPSVRVEAWPGRLPMLDALRCLQRAGRLVFLGSDEAAYTPSRLFPYLMAKKPLLAVLHSQSPAFQRMSALSTPGLMGFTAGENPKGVGEKIAGLAWERGVNLDGDLYTAKMMSRDLCKLFDRVADTEGVSSKIKRG